MFHCKSSWAVAKSLFSIGNSSFFVAKSLCSLIKSSYFIAKSLAWMVEALWIACWKLHHERQDLVANCECVLFRAMTLRFFVMITCQQLSLFVEAKDKHKKPMGFLASIAMEKQHLQTGNFVTCYAGHYNILQQDKAMKIWNKPQFVRCFSPSERNLVDFPALDYQEYLESNPWYHPWLIHL